MPSLRPLSADEFAEYLRRAILRHAERFVRRGFWLAAEANAASEATYARILPQGLATPNQHFATILDDRGDRVGEVWYADEREGGVVQFWVKWILIDPEHRRHGYARWTLRHLESEARARGALRVGLDVFEDNPGALALYRSLGYRTIRTSLVKSVGESRA